MNSHYNTDYDYFINIDTENYIKMYDDDNNPIYYKTDIYIQPHLIYNNYPMEIDTSYQNNYAMQPDTPYKHIDYRTAILITHIIGGFVVCIVTIFIIM